MTLAKTLRWWHTLRHLRPVQFYARAWFRLYRPRVDSRPAPARRCAARAMPLHEMQSPSLLTPWVFRFLNEEHSLDAMTGWDDPSVARLWRYNLHYFDDLTAKSSASRAAWHRELLVRWIEANPPATGTGWEPYPTSLRIVNWIRWSLAGNRLTPSLLNSLACQIRWLRKRLEHHLLGNHLWANAKALVFAGVFFDGEEAKQWRAQGLRLLRREFREQVLSDGGHFERSPMYHSVVLHDLLELIALDMTFPGTLPGDLVQSWRAGAERMLRWLRVMSHPDGDIALFNDAAFGIGAPWSALAVTARNLGLHTDAVDANLPVVDLSESGYVRLQSGPAVMLADVGPLGPDYIPGHAHADTLSFELSVHAQRVVVDTGTSRYDAGPERLKQRSTAAHNTVEINETSSSDVWSSFRVGRRARPFGRTLVESRDFISLTCSHDGYASLSGKPTHRREWTLQPQGLRVTDHVEGAARSAVARYHFHPLVQVELTLQEANSATGHLRLPAGQIIRWRATGGSVRSVATSHHPEFNQSVPNRCLELHLSGPCGEVEFNWD